MQSCDTTQRRPDTDNDWKNTTKCQISELFAPDQEDGTLQWQQQKVIKSSSGFKR